MNKGTSEDKEKMQNVAQKFDNVNHFTNTSLLYPNNKHEITLNGQYNEYILISKV